MRVPGERRSLGPLLQIDRPPAETVNRWSVASLRPPGGPRNENTLVVRCQLGEHAAWRLLHREYHPVAAAFLRRLGVKGRELEDACQEVFLRMFRFLPSFRGEADLKTWLYRLCATEAARLRRRSRSSGDVLALLAGEPADLAMDGPGISATAAAEKCRAALRQMTEAERLVFVLYEMDGLSGHQIAQAVGCPVATVWRRLHYARRRFRHAVLGAEDTAA